MMKKLIILIIFFPIFYFSQTIAKVVAIKDGDTIVILLHDKSQKTLRLAEVDCPESGQPFGKNAKQFTASLIFGKMVKYYAVSTDRYDRTIAKVYLMNGNYLSAEIIRAGFGWWYERYSDDLSLEKLHNDAKYKKLGLWVDNKAISPYQWRLKNN